MQIRNLQFHPAETPAVSAELRLTSALAFQPDLQLQILGQGAGEMPYCRNLGEAIQGIAWLPRGDYRVECRLNDLELPAGDYRLRLIAFAETGGERSALADESEHFRLTTPLSVAGLAQAAWNLQSAEGTTPVECLGWNRGHEDWFFRHFDHAALVITELLMKKHPLLRGRILDVGCGDGITDLGIFLRMQPKELVGIDPFEGFRRLPGVVRDNHLPDDVLGDDRLSFQAESVNDIPYPDDYFDVVISWGTMEHIVGGYRQALLQIRRVLKKDGLFFVHPGLYYGALGNHLVEFFDDPHIHLKLPEAVLRESVLNAEPRRMDRAGHVATPEEYWQWYTELNPIRVPEFERELRELGFEPWRVAIRSSDVIEYTPELLDYPLQDLATAELYLSAWNRKS